jgi:3-oxoacyl-[acyl-carrier protein] reductase
MDLDGKVAIVTGGSRGIGRAIVIALARKGSVVVINYTKNRQKAEETLKECKKLSNGMIFKADVRRRDEVRMMVEGTISKFGKIDILVNNAGVLGKTTDLTEISDGEWDEVLDVNLKGAFIVTQEVLRYMKKGKIVNISSLAGKEGGVMGAHYAASKGGLIAMTFNLARHLAPDILVNAIAPGPVDTELLDDETKERLKGLSLIRKIAKPEDVASAVIFLLENDHITGEVVDVNGGRLMD